MQNRIQKLTIVFLILSSISAMLLHWQATIHIEKGSEALEKWEDHLRPVRDVLPIKRGIVGFVSDWNVPGMEFDASDQQAEFLLTQYALAPLILVDGPVADWNVAILNKRAFAMWQESNPGHFKIIPLKHNVYILHRLGDE
jgi:hypothetical protein